MYYDAAGQQPCSRTNPVESLHTKGNTYSIPNTLIWNGLLRRSPTTQSIMPVSVPLVCVSTQYNTYLMAIYLHSANITVNDIDIVCRIWVKCMWNSRYTAHEYLNTICPEMRAPRPSRGSKNERS